MTQRKQYLRRDEVPAFLEDEFAIRIAASTLAKLASLGGGPPYHKVNRSPIYPVDRLREWAADRMGEPRVSAAEHVG